MNRAFHFTLLAMVAASLLVGCAAYVRKADYLPSKDAAPDAHPAPVMLREISFKIPVGADVGFESNQRFCGWPYAPVGRKVMREALDRDAARASFHDALEAQGYDVVRTIDVEFDPEDELARAEYMVAAKITDMEVEMCHREADRFLMIFSTRRGTEGEIHMTVDWTVYDALRRRTVYKTTTEGYTKRRIPNQEGLALMLDDAFGMAAHNLGADDNLYNLLFYGTQTDAWKKDKVPDESDIDRPRRFSADEEVTIINPPLLTAPLESHAERSRRAAVMIEAGGGHGSGFFITDKGHILTNAHVVGDARLVRVVSAGRQEKMIAEVLRINKARDVALIRLESVPDDLKIVTLPIRAEWPTVSETVYAIGAPQHTKLQDTLTRGIVSAHRRDYKDGSSGIRTDFIQADVTLHGGNSGGPLLDAYGNIVGLSVLGLYMDDTQRNTGLNLFVPVGEALATLDIALRGKTP